MKKLFTFCIVLFTFILVSNAVVWPTKIIKVDPDKGTSIGALQTSILANGSAIYELKRGGIYFTNGMFTIPATAGTLIIRAEAGTGPRPVIMGGVPASGYPSGDNVMRISGDIKFENIYLTGEDMNAVVHKNTLRVTAGTWFEFNGCMFDKDAAASIRNGVGTCTYIFNDCTFRNNVDYAGMSNGRAWDAREAYKNITLIIKNCTFYSLSSRIIRPSTSDFDSIVFVNNTCYNIHEALVLGYARKAVVNNNIFYNVGLGGASSATGGIITIDSVKTAGADATRKFEVRNNLFYTDKQYLDVMKSDSLYHRGILDLTARAFMKSGQLVVSDTIKNQSIPFTNPSPFIVDYVKYIWDNKGPSAFKTTPTASQKIEAMEDPLNFGDVIAPKKAYNFGYPTTHMAYKAGLNGSILGDKKYFGPITASQNLSLGNMSVKAFFSSGTKTLNLIFNTEEAANFKLRIYGLDGKKLAERIISNYGQLISKVQLDELKNGFYIYQINGVTLKGSEFSVSGKVVM